MEAKRIIKEVDLVADSICKAQYHLSLCELEGGVGYVITKESGPAGKGKLAESWYRDSLELAVKKYEGIFRSKTSRSTGRRYRVAEFQGQGAQLSLLG